jgi:glutathione S-transferase
MSDPVTLVGFRHSVYQRIVRVALREKGVAFRVEEVDPFAPDAGERLRGLHPFGRVPVLRHGRFDLYETSAITRYVDATFDGPRLVPDGAQAAARMAQVIALLDANGYWPMIRQVFARRVFAPDEDTTTNEAEVAEGLAASRPVLAALEAIAAEGRVLSGGAITLADCHCGAMMDYFTRAPEGDRLLRSHPHLEAWWRAIGERPSITDLDGPAGPSR